jgi:hypothetical protein
VERDTLTRFRLFTMEKTVLRRLDYHGYRCNFNPCPQLPPKFDQQWATRNANSATTAPDDNDNTLSKQHNSTLLLLVYSSQSTVSLFCGCLLTTFLLRDFYVNSVLVSFDFLATERSRE